MEDRQVLLTCMVENLNHARHVENERLAYSSLSIAFTASLLLIIVNNISGSSVFNLLIIAFLMLNTLLGFLLCKRWGTAHVDHMKKAEEICQLLKLDNPESEANKYYCFKITKAKGVTPLMNTLFKSGTRDLFNFFYFVIFLMLFFCWLWVGSTGQHGLNGGLLLLISLSFLFIFNEILINISHPAKYSGSSRIIHALVIALVNIFCLVWMYFRLNIVSVKILWPGDGLILMLLYIAAVLLSIIYQGKPKNKLTNIKTKSKNKKDQVKT